LRKARIKSKALTASGHGSKRGGSIKNGKGKKKDELNARVLIPVGKKEALVVPKQAVVEKGQLVGVYTVGKDGVVNYRLIRTGNKYDGGVEVLSGLKAGDTIIVEGTDKAVDGGVLEQN